MIRNQKEIEKRKTNMKKNDKSRKTPFFKTGVGDFDFTIGNSGRNKSIRLTVIN